MTFYARLKHGSKYLDLSSGDYYLLPEFTPPSASSIPLMSGGSMLNRYSGGKRIDRSFADRGMNLPLRIQGASAAETHGLVRKLSAFIEVAMNDSTNPLYFVFGESNAVPYEPKWGQQFKYYEVKDAEQAIGNLYGIASINQSAIFVNVPLLVAPFATGLRQRVGSATGLILERSYATPDGLSRGTQLHSAKTNLVTNPVFGHGTWDNDWTEGAGMRSSENTNKEYILFGSSSAKLTCTAAAANSLSISVTAPNTSSHCFSVFAKLPDGGVISSSIMGLSYDGNNLTETFTAVGDGWYLIHAQYAGVALPAVYAIHVSPGYTVYVDMVGAEDGDFFDGPKYGDMMDVTWAGTAHDSTSGATCGRLRYASANVLDPAEFSVIVDWMPDIAHGSYGSTDYTIFEDASGISLIFDGAANTYEFTDGTNTATSAGITFAAMTPIQFIAVASPVNGLVLYVNGVSTATDGTYTPPALSDYFYVGVTAAGNL